MASKTLLLMHLLGMLGMSSAGEVFAVTSDTAQALNMSHANELTAAALLVKEIGADFLPPPPTSSSSPSSVQEQGGAVALANDRVKRAAGAVHSSKQEALRLKDAALEARKHAANPDTAATRILEKAERPGK